MTEQETAAGLFSRGLEKHLANDWPAAEALYREALALAPGRPSVTFNLGRLLLDRKRFREAEGYLAESARLAPDDHAARYNLALCLARLERHEEAVVQFERAVALDPDDADAHAQLGNSLAALHRIDGALESCARAVALAPARRDLQIRFARCAALAPALPEGVPPGLLERASLACLDAANVQYQDLGHLVSCLLERKFAGIKRRCERDGFDIGALVAGTEDGPPFCSDPLHLAALESILVTSSADEAFYTGLRRGLLRWATRDSRAGASWTRLEPLAAALACQCFLNEYVWSVTGEEGDAVARLASGVAAALADGSVQDGELAALACYEPLHGMAGIEAWVRGRAAGSVAFARLLQRQVLEPFAEREIAARRGLPLRAADPVSRAVQAQYEANPYPRWLTVYRNAPAPYVDRIAAAIAPHAPALKPTAAQPRILIAGCGTGKEAIAYAQACENARCTAMDLSGASLAYAQRKAGELGLGNIEFVQGDILELAAREVFDVVSCSGVLHHMAVPERGLERLVAALKAGGYLMLALYSDRARRDVSSIRALIAARGLDASVAGIRACREMIRAEPGDRFRALVEEENDFYSTSMARDLLFHVQEHRYTLPEIGALLARHGLEFLGFQSPDPSVKGRYRAAYPGDPDMLDLSNWDELERAHPRLFRGMYQMWTRKRFFP